MLQLSILNQGSHIAVSKQIVPQPIITEQEAANLKHVVQGQVSDFYKSCWSQFVTSVLPTYFMFLFYAQPRNEVLWETYNVELCDNLKTNVQNWENEALLEIEQILEHNSESLRNFPNMPILCSTLTTSSIPNLIRQEM